MGNGLGELGFWLAVGMVIAAMIVSGAIKERDRERDRQAMLRADWERKQATRQSLLENAGENMPEVLAYLRERDAAAAARGAEAMARMDADVRRRRAREPRVFAIVGAFVVGAFFFLGGMIVAGTLSPHPEIVQRFPRFEYSAQAGRVVPVPPPPVPPPPTGWAAFAPAGAMLGIWAAGLIIAALLVFWAVRQNQNDAQPDA
jgi:hypothetical protein